MANILGSGRSPKSDELFNQVRTIYKREPSTSVHLQQHNLEYLTLPYTTIDEKPFISTCLQSKLWKLYMVIAVKEDLNCIGMVVFNQKDQSGTYEKDHSRMIVFFDWTGTLTNKIFASGVKKGQLK